MMKKFLLVSASVLLISCGGTSTVDKVDEKGHNPAPEQVVDADCIPAMVIDSIAVRNQE